MSVRVVQIFSITSALTSGSVQSGFVSGSHVAWKCVLEASDVRSDTFKGAVRVALLFGVEGDHVHEFV